MVVLGKIVMPKNSALLNEIEAVLDIYYEADGWLANADYTQKLKELIGDAQYSSSYTKKAQMTSYFGFTEGKEKGNSRADKRITASGRLMYEAIKSEKSDQINEIIMNALENVTFGRDNFGVPSSDSDIEPPNLFIRSILDLGYLTYKEFAFLLWELEDKGNNYTDVLKELKVLRTKYEVFELDEEAVKYTDCKPIMMLVRWGFLLEGESATNGTKILIQPPVLEKYKSRLRNLKVYNIDKNVEVRATIDDSSRVNGGENILLYGVPGSGKSHEIETKYCNDESKIERIVFHPDYMNTDFIGQILPTVKKDKSITYEFISGPFTRILHDAYKNPNSMYFLVIEEINRGNAPAIFGEIFQLLDRKSDGESVYKITNHNVSNNVYGSIDKKVGIPSNLTILATMNTADQNVFTLDTAFQRRWKMVLIENDVKSAKHAKFEILDTKVTWEKFNTIINGQILENSASTLSSEDKRLGAYFIIGEDLLKDNSSFEDFKNTNRLDKFKSSFAEKVVKYLWDDAFKFDRSKLFNSKYRSLEEVVDTFSKNEGVSRFEIFKPEISDLLTRKLSKPLLGPGDLEPEEITVTQNEP